MNLKVIMTHTKKNRKKIQQMAYDFKHINSRKNAKVSTHYLGK